MQRIGRQINPASILAFVALVFAITGGAYAAGGGLHANGAKANTKASSKGVRGPRGPAGPRGATGAAGPAGAAGATGPAGPAGARGENGANGTNGTNGADGQSVTSKALNPKENTHCEEGGSEFKVGTKATYACSGKTGFAEVLPPGKMEVGTWGASGTSIRLGFFPGVMTSISFPVPLTASLPFNETEPEKNRVHVVLSGEKGEGEYKAGVSGKDGLTTGCPEAAEATKPEAEPGNLCVFVHTEAGVEEQTLGTVKYLYLPIDMEETGFSRAAGRTGLTLLIAKPVGETAAAGGTWAVKEAE